VNEIARYTLDNCSLEAKFIREKSKASVYIVSTTQKSIDEKEDSELSLSKEESNEESEDESDRKHNSLYRNPFLLQQDNSDDSSD